MKPRHFYSLDILKDELIRLFDRDPKVKTLFLQKFYNRVQLFNESVVDYGTALCRLAEDAFVFNGRALDKVILEQFEVGLFNKEIRRWVRNEKYNSFDDALDAAIKYESELGTEFLVNDSCLDSSGSYYVIVCKF